MPFLMPMIGWRNAFISGALAASSQQAALPVTNLQNDQGSFSMGWQPTGCTAEFVTLDSGSDLQMWQIVGLFRTNLTVSASLRIQIGATVLAGVISDIAFDSGWINAALQVDNGVGYMQSVTLLPSPQMGRVMRVDIVDPSNPDGFINVPLAFAGPATILMANQDYSGGFGSTDGTIEINTRGGQSFAVNSWEKRTSSVSLQAIRSREIWNSLAQVDSFARTNGNILWVPDPLSADINRQAIFGRMKPGSAFTRPYDGADRRGYKFTMTERL